MSQTLHSSIDTGSNANSGTIDFPFKTINFGAARVGPGDTLLVAPGIYDESIINPACYGTSWAASDKCTIAAYPGGGVWLSPSGGLFTVYLGSSSIPRYIEFNGVNIDGRRVEAYTFKIEAGPGYDAHHIRLQNAEVLGPTNPVGGGGSTIILYNGPGNDSGGSDNEFLNLRVHGGGRSNLNQDHQFYVGTSRNVIYSCDVYEAAGFGIQIWNEFKNQALITTGPHDNIVSSNRVHHSIVGSGGGGGIVLGTDTNTLVYNNIVYRIVKGGTSFGFLVYTSTNPKIYNNTVAFCVQDGFRIDAATSGAVLRNNISFGHGGNNYSDSGSGTTEDHNLFSSDPLFVNGGADDYRLSDSSPALNAGVTV